MKINSSDFVSGGMEENESLEICKMLAAAGIDFIYAQTNDALGEIETYNAKTCEKELIGSWNERFSYTEEDIDAYLDYEGKKLSKRDFGGSFARREQSYLLFVAPSR